MKWENMARKALADTFLNALKEDTIPWRKCWNAAPLSMSTGKPYRGINNLMLSFVADEKGYQDTRWMTYKYAKDHGWQVRKGEKSVRVEYWTHYDVKLKKTLDRAEVVRIQREEPERMKDIRLAAYTYNVFNAEQIDGDIPSQKRTDIQDPTTIRDCRDAFLANLGVKFREAGDQAFYSPVTDTITLPQMVFFNSSDYGYVCTLLHEAGHATGHPSRLNRQLRNEFGSPDYAREELRAEIASAFTAQALQLPCWEEKSGAGPEALKGNHKAYIQSWITVLEKDPNELFAAIKDADQIADYLLERGQLLELVKATIQSRYMSVEELNQNQLDELKDRLFWQDMVPREEFPQLTEEQLAQLEAAQFPDDIPNEIVYATYAGTSFVPDDFSCSYERGEETQDTEEDYEPEP